MFDKKVLLRETARGVPCPSKTHPWGGAGGYPSPGIPPGRDLGPVTAVTPGRGMGPVTVGPPRRDMGPVVGSIMGWRWGTPPPHV